MAGYNVISRLALAISNRYRVIHRRSARRDRRARLARIVRTRTGPLVLRHPILTILTIALIGKIAEWRVGRIEAPAPVLLGVSLLVLVLVVWGWWCVRRHYVRRVVLDWPCLHCGYALRHQNVDHNGCGRCPECGSRFDRATYRPQILHRRRARRRTSDPSLVSA